MEKKVFRNISTNLFLQITLTVSGLLVPRYILTCYGSEMNGLVSSISQFITYAALIEMGIGDATIIALYRPIAENNIADIGNILSSSKKMYVKSGLIYLSIIWLIALLYPLLLAHKFGYTFTFMMVLCIGAVNAVDYFILGKYKVLLIAGQKYYILNAARTLATIALTAGSILLLHGNVSILWIKVLAILTHLGEALFIHIYIKTKYSYLNYHSKTTPKIGQRWNALVCQICATIVYNTDLVVLTLCLLGHDLSEISVYTVYSMVFSLLTNLSGILVTGINASFGNLFAKNEYERLYRFFELYELLYFMVLFIVCTTFAALIVPFVSCYTRGVDDANYIRYGVGLLFAANGLSAQIKEVSGMICNAAGKIKEIQKYAIEEAVVNIAISLLLVWDFEIIGVLVGTLASHIVMSVQMILYASRKLVCGTGRRTFQRIFRNLTAMSVLVFLEMHFIKNTQQWFMWISQAIAITIINAFFIIVINYFCEPSLINHIFAVLREKVDGTLRRSKIEN